jgi:hypothetical protein
LYYIIAYKTDPGISTRVVRSASYRSRMVAFLLPLMLLVMQHYHIRNTNMRNAQIPPPLIIRIVGVLVFCGFSEIIICAFCFFKCVFRILNRFLSGILLPYSAILFFSLLRPFLSILRNFSGGLLFFSNSYFFILSLFQVFFLRFLSLSSLSSLSLHYTS